jgi:hypothetical protein
LDAVLRFFFLGIPLGLSLGLACLIGLVEGLTNTRVSSDINIFATGILFLVSIAALLWVDAKNKNFQILKQRLAARIKASLQKK